MLKVTRERLFPRPPGTIHGFTNIRVIGIHFGPCILDIDVKVSPRLILVHEFVCHLQNRHCIFSEVLLYDHEKNKYVTLLSSLPSASRILSAAISPDGHFLAISTATRSRGTRYQYTITVANLKQQDITASIRLRSPADVCFPGNSSHLLVLTYVPILAKIFVRRTRMQTQQLIIRPIADPLHVFGEVLHIQSTPPYILAVELPTSSTKYVDTDGSKHMYARFSGKLDTPKSTLVLVLRLYQWHENQLNEIRRFPITIPARYKIYPFPGRASIQSKSILIDLVTAPQPIAIFSCHSLGCTMIKICACLTASIFTFSLAKPLQKQTEEVNNVAPQSNAQSKNTSPITNMSNYPYKFQSESIKISLHKFILLVHTNYLVFIQPFSLSTAQLVIVSLPPYGPMYIAYSSLIPFQICNLQIYHTIKQVFKLSTIANYISKHPSQSQYILHYMTLSLIGMTKEKILADIHASRTAMDCILEYAKSSMDGSCTYADTPFGFVSYTDLAKVYICNRVRRIAGLSEAPAIDMDVLDGLSNIRTEELMHSDTIVPHPTIALSSIIMTALNEASYWKNTIAKTSSKTIDSNMHPNIHQDVSATNFSISQNLQSPRCITSAMHTYQTDYTDEFHSISAVNNPSIGSPLSSFTELNIMYSNIHNINNSSTEFLDNVIITSITDTTISDDLDELSQQKLSQLKEVSISTITSKRKLLFPQIFRKKRSKKSQLELDTSTISATSKNSTSSKAPSKSNIITDTDIDTNTVTTTVTDMKDTEREPLENDFVDLSLKLAYLGHPISGSINFPMQSTIDINSFLKYTSQSSDTLNFKEINEICYLSRSWRYTTIPSFYSSTEELSREITFTVFDTLLQRQIDLTIDLSQVAVGLCYPPKTVSTCLCETRLLRLNHKLAYLYHRYTQLFNINLLSIASNMNIPAASSTQLYNSHIKWWKRTLADLRSRRMLEYSTIIVCILEKVSSSLTIATPKNSTAVQFSSFVLKALLLNTYTTLNHYPRSLAINLYSNPLHIFLHSVNQDNILIDSPWSKCTTMYAAHSYLHINNTVDNYMFPTQPYTNKVGTTITIQQSELSQQHAHLYDPSMEKNIRFCAGKATELYKYMTVDSICPVHVNSYAQKCRMELNKYVSNTIALNEIVPRLYNFSNLITHTSNSTNQISSQNDTGASIDLHILCASDSLEMHHSLNDYDHIWRNSAIYREFAAIVEPFYSGIAPIFFKQLYVDILFMCEACIEIDTSLLIEEFILIISVLESLNLTLLGHKSTNRVFKRTLALLYNSFPDELLQKMLSLYL